MAFVGCSNVLLEDFTITSGPNWTVHPIYCDDVLIRGITVDTHGPNNDGIDVDSCRNVVIEDCSFNTGDDCVVLKSGYNQDGWRVGRPTENVVMRRCRGRNGHGGLVVGSEMSGDVRNVLMTDCDFEGTDHVLRIKSRIDRGGVVERVYVDGVRARDLKRDVVLLTMGYTADRVALGAARPPVFRDVVVANVTAEGAPAAIIVQGLAESPIQDCRFENLTLSSVKGITLEHASRVTFRDIALAVQRGPVLEARAVRGLRLERMSPAAPDSARITISPGTSEVELSECGFATREGAVRIEPGVPATAVTVR
jgi:hypothetical protein